MAPRGPCPSFVVRQPEVVLDPGIQQSVAGSGVETDDRGRRIPADEGHIGDAADVDDGAIVPFIPEKPAMEGRYEGCALAACGHVAAPEVSHCRDTGAFGNAAWIADLQRKGLSPGGAMPKRLAVGADRANVVPLQIRRPAHTIGRRCEYLGQLGFQCTHPVDFIGTRGHERKNARAQRRTIGFVPVREDAQVRSVAKMGDHGVHAVGAGSGHKAYEMVRHACSVHAGDAAMVPLWQLRRIGVSESIEAALTVIRQGTAAIVSESELRTKLGQGRPLRVKAGFDPTAPDLHLGHTVLLRKLRQFQDLGHTVLFLIGDFTGRIGDPTGKNTTRPPLSAEDVARNAQSYENQVFKILDRSRTEVVFNSQWMGQMGAYDLVRLASHYTVARLLERDDFEKRYTAGQPIAVHEFLYPLIQGYDSVALHADIELGGTDQRFNLLVGRDLQRDYGQEPQVVITLPILEGTDGVQKMSKSLNNAIGVMDEPAMMFGKLMSIPDAVMWRYFELLSMRPPTELDELRRFVNNGGNPRDVKLALAHELVGRFHCAEAADQSRQQFLDVFSRGALPASIDERRLVVPPEGLSIARALKAAELVATTSEALRLLRQGGVKVDGERADESWQFMPGSERLVQIGKRRFLRLQFRENSA